MWMFLSGKTVPVLLATCVSSPLSSFCSDQTRLSISLTINTTLTCLYAFCKPLASPIYMLEEYLECVKVLITIVGFHQCMQDCQLIACLSSGGEVALNCLVARILKDRLDILHIHMLYSPVTNCKSRYLNDYTLLYVKTHFFGLRTKQQQMTFQSKSVIRSSNEIQG